MTTPVARPRPVAASPLKGATTVARHSRFRGVGRTEARPLPAASGRWRASRGFTLIELMVVMAIIATLLSVVAPRYFQHLDRARETALRQTLAVTRDAIDKFHADHDRYPASLDELVSRRYLRTVPVDPVTDSADTWTLLAPPAGADDATGGLAGGVWDLRSGAQAEGKRYDQW